MVTAKKLTVMHLVISLETGGLERFVINLIAENEKFCDQFIVCLERSGNLADSCLTQVIMLNMKPGVHIGAAWKIAGIAREKHVDIIHTHNEKAQLYGVIAGFLARVPVVHTKHGKNNTDWRSIVRNNFAARFSQKVVAVSRDAALECIQDEMIPISKVVTILNGVDTVRFSPNTDQEDLKKRFGLTKSTLGIGVVARLAQVKDHATLLQTCRLLVDSGEKIRLLVIGDGDLRGQLEKLTHSLAINEEVIFTGMREDIPDLMRALDIFVLSSLSEGIPITLLEAMASCLPVVATAVGGNPEVVIDGVTGFLVPSQRPELLADKLRVLISNRGLRQAMGIAGRQRVVDYFSISETAHKYRQLYFSSTG